MWPEEDEIIHRDFKFRPAIQHLLIGGATKGLVILKSGRIDRVYVSGKWCEIDTPQDLEKAKKLFS